MEKVISLKTAKLAKEKGFNLNSPAYYGCDNPSSGNSNQFFTRSWVKWEDLGDEDPQEGTLIYSAPTQNLLKTWLRKKHNIDVDVSRDSEIHFKDETRWIAKVSDWNDIKIVEYSIAHLKHPNHFHFIDFKSYEEALEEGLLQALNLIK